MEPLRSIIGKLMDKIILLNYYATFLTSDQQFGFKRKHSTTQCTFIINESINYYNVNATTVKLCNLSEHKDCAVNIHFNFVTCYNINSYI